jgi:hypothetical protein
MIEDRVVRTFFHRDALQVIADEMQARGAASQIMNHLDVLATSKLRSVIRALIERHLRVNLMQWQPEWIGNRRPIRSITIRNVFTGA